MMRHLVIDDEPERFSEGVKRAGSLSVFVSPAHFLQTHRCMQTLKQEVESGAVRIYIDTVLHCEKREIDQFLQMLDATGVHFVRYTNFPTSRSSKGLLSLNDLRQQIRRTITNVTAAIGEVVL